ncbi:ATP-binding protein [Streptomyces sp. NPDC091972]|uniref:ATP-binding protein n=1 Tax=Streptomyces sp. NPDC091972 TaxID=3366007 RepID=UPI00380CA601
MSTMQTTAADQLGHASARPDMFSYELASSSASVPTCRRIVRAAAEQWALSADTAYALMVIVSELATNVCLHSGSPDMQLALRNGSQSVEVEVADRGQWKAPQNERLAKTATSGRGLDITHAYAEGFALHRSPSGTRAVARVGKQAAAAA